MKFGNGTEYLHRSIVAPKNACLSRMYMNLKKGGDGAGQSGSQSNLGK